MSDSRYSRSKIDGLGKLLDSTLDQLGMRHKLMECQALQKWPEIVGPKIANAALVETVRDGILFVSCKSHTWANELTLHKAEILKRMNSALGGKVVKEIRFSGRGFASLARQRRKEEKTADEKVPSSQPVSDKDLKAADDVAAQCTDEELKQRVRSAILSAKRLWNTRREEGWKECPECGALHKQDTDICDRCAGKR